MSEDIDIGQISEALNDKVDLDGSWGFPSNNYDDLTLGASGTTYIAQDDGFVFVNANGSSTSNIGFSVTNVTKNYILGTALNGKYTTSNVLLPVTKGDVFEVYYQSSVTISRFRFIYAQKTN